MNETTPTIELGSIFSMSWGYDQTNVNFFQVVGITPASVKVKEIESKGVEGTSGFMCQNVVAVKDSFLKNSQWADQEKGKLFRLNKQRNGFLVKGCYYAGLWNGKPTYCSWYA